MNISQVEVPKKKKKKAIISKNTQMSFNMFILYIININNKACF